MRIISAPTTPPPSIAPESPQDGPAAASSQAQADQADPNPEEDEPSGEQSRPDQIYAAAINLLDAAMKLGKDGGQHALAASEMMATAVKAAEPGGRDWIKLGEQMIKLGEQIGQVAFAVRDAHRSHQASPRVEDVQEAVLSPKEQRWERYTELRRKVEAKTATEAEQKELEQIDAEMSAEVLQATRTRFYREVFDRTREHLIANIGTCHAVALQNDPSGEKIQRKIQRFHQDVNKAIDTLEALERTLPDAPPYLVICGK